MKSVVQYARLLQDKSYRGDLDFFVGVCNTHQAAIKMLGDSLEELQTKLKQAEEHNIELLRRNQHLTDRVLRYALGKPQDIPPENPTNQPA